MKECMRDPWTPVFLNAEKQQYRKWHTPCLHENYHHSPPLQIQERELLRGTPAGFETAGALRINHSLIKQMEQIIKTTKFE